MDNCADVNAMDYCKDTPLIYTVQPSQTNCHDARQRADILRLLLEHDADKTLCGKYSGTALEAARKYRQSSADNDWDELIELLS